MSFWEFLDKISPLILIITLIAIIWYTWETKKLREQTAKQTELQYRPFVMVFMKQGEEEGTIDGDAPFCVKNVGHSPALNVKIYYYDVNGKLSNKKFHDIDLLVPNEIRRIEEIEWKGEKTLLQIKFSELKGNLIIECKNILLENFYTEVRIRDCFKFPQCKIDLLDTQKVKKQGRKWQKTLFLFIMLTQGDKRQEKCNPEVMKYWQMAGI